MEDMKEGGPGMRWGPRRRRQGPGYGEACSILHAPEEREDKVQSSGGKVGTWGKRLWAVLRETRGEGREPVATERQRHGVQQGRRQTLFLPQENTSLVEGKALVITKMSVK